MLDRTSRIAVIVIAVCLSFNLVRDLVGMYVGTATAQPSPYSVPTIKACNPYTACMSGNAVVIDAVPVIQVLRAPGR